MVTPSCALAGFASTWQAIRSRPIGPIRRVPLDYQTRRSADSCSGCTSQPLPAQLYNAALPAVRRVIQWQSHGRGRYTTHQPVITLHSTIHVGPGVED